MGDMTEAQKRRAADMQRFRQDLLGAGKTYGKLLEANESELLRFMAEAEHVVENSKNDKLLHANRTGLLVALGEAAASRLSINPTMGEAYLIPRKGSVDFQSGYKGLVKLMYRSGMIDSLHVDVVYKGEEYNRTGGTNPGIDHTPDDSKRTGKLDDIVGAYAVVWLIGSSRPMFRAITRATIIEAAEASGDPRNNKYSDVWRSHPEAMAWKTALTRCANQLPRSDKFRDFHLASSRAILRDANVELPAIAGLEALAPTALPPADTDPFMTAKLASKASAAMVRCARIAAAKSTDDKTITPRAVWEAACAKFNLATMPDGSTPKIEQLRKSVAFPICDLIKTWESKLEPEIIEGEYTEREPGEDRGVDDEQPPAGWKPRHADPRRGDEERGGEDMGDEMDNAASDYHEQAGDR